MIEKAYHDRDGEIWLDGDFVNWRETKIHVLTHSLHYGSCVFEGNRAYEGEIFRLTDHSKRLVKSAKLLGYEIPYTLEQIDQACLDTLEKTGLQDAYIRPFAWRGSDMMGVASKNNQIHFGVAAWHWGRRDIHPAEMPHFEECFIVGTAAEVTPVREIDGNHYTIGEMCRTLVSDYDDCVRGKIKLS